MNSRRRTTAAPVSAPRLKAAAFVVVGVVGGALLTVWIGRLLLPFSIGWYGLLLPVAGAAAVAAVLWRLGPRLRLVAGGMAAGSVLLVAHGIVLVALFY